MMVMNCAEQKTAKIYTFPTRPRALSTQARLARLEAEARAYGTVDYGSSWYHDDAIAEDSAQEKSTRRS